MDMFRNRITAKSQKNQLSRKKRISKVDVILTSSIHALDHNILIRRMRHKAEEKRLCAGCSFDEIHTDMKEKINSLREKRITDIEKICTCKNVFRSETRQH